MKKNLYVSNIDYDVTDSELLEVFKGFGKVESARVITDRESGKSRGYGFVDMATAVDAEKALGADGMQVGSRNIRVSFAREK